MKQQSNNDYNFCFNLKIENEKKEEESEEDLKEKSKNNNELESVKESLFKKLKIQPLKDISFF